MYNKCMHLCMHVHAYREINCTQKSICDWLCENPPCLRANFDLLLGL